ERHRLRLEAVPARRRCRSCGRTSRGSWRPTSADDVKRALRKRHTMLRMAQGSGELDSLVRKRIRALRVAQGWSLEELATRANLSQSSLSRIENGQRRLALDQLVTLARALDTTLDQLVETATDDV